MTGPDQDSALRSAIRQAQADARANGKLPPGNGSAGPSDQETEPNQQRDDHRGGNPPKEGLYPPITGTLRLGDLAKALGWDDADHVQVSHISTMPEHVAKERGKSFWFTRMITDVQLVQRLLAATETPVGEALNWYYGPCPVAPNFLDRRPDVKDHKTREMRRPRGGRPNKHDITRLAGVWMDLDFKAKEAGGCGNRETAEKIIAAVSEILGCKPAIVISSGHGLQPLWYIEDGQITKEFTTADANTLLARLGELAAAVAARFGASVDGVFEAARLLRMPGSINHKVPDEPVLAEIVPELGGGGALSVPELSDRLGEFGIPEAPRHRARGESSSLGPVVSEPGSWQWATETCRYTAATVEKWATARAGGKGRHPWLTSQWVRLAAMHRHGCITEVDYRAAEQVLTERFTHLCATTGDKREVGPGEVQSVAGWAVAYAATLGDDHLAGELGSHTHGTSVAGAGDVIIRGEPEFLEWCRENIGTGPSSGVFLSVDGELTIVRAIGETGYVSPPPLPPDAPADTALPSNGSHTFERITRAPQLSGILRRRYKFMKSVKVGDVYELKATAPPMRSFADVLGSPRDMQAVRALTGAVTAPCLLSDGSLLTKPGYHAASGIVYLPAPGMLDVRVPEAPAGPDAAAAVKVLTGMLTGFGFVNDHHRANYLAAMITPAIRRAVGCVPLVAINAGDRGSGKTSLSLLAGIPYGGAAVRGPLPRDNEDEVAKILGTIWLTSAAPVVVFDNLTGVLKSENFAALATATISVRMLGSNTSITLTPDRLIIINGNNITIGGDHDRRFMWVRLDPGMPEAWKRPASDFDIDNLLGHAHEHRFDMLAAVLTMVRAWVVAGRPSPVGYRRRSDNFADWHEMVSGILAFAGIAEPVMDESTEEHVDNPEAEDHAALLRYAFGRFGCTQWTVKELAKPPVGRPLDGDPYDWVPAAVATPLGAPDRRSLGRYLSNRQDRYADGLRAVSAGQDRDGVRKWAIQTYQSKP